jgi:hypothetical protein
MEIIKHSTCNATLGVSAEQAAAGIVPLPINRAQEDGVPVVQSFWKPDADELAYLNAGHPIVLSVFGHTHAPLRISVALDKD